MLWDYTRNKHLNNPKFHQEHQRFSKHSYPRSPKEITEELMKKLLRKITLLKLNCRKKTYVIENHEK